MQCFYARVYAVFGAASNGDMTAQAGAAHPQRVLLDQEGIVTAIGADRSACMVQFGDKVHKLLTGRGGAFQLAVATRGKQEGAVHEQSGAKSSLSAGLIGLELTVREGQVHVSDVLAVAEGNISKGDRILEIASQPVGQVCPLPIRWLRVLL